LALSIADSFIGPLAIALGGTPMQIGLLSAFPQLLAAQAQLLTHTFVAWVRSRKGVLLIAAYACRIRGHVQGVVVSGAGRQLASMAFLSTTAASAMPRAKGLVKAIALASHAHTVPTLTLVEGVAMTGLEFRSNFGSTKAHGAYPSCRC
jgi:hypothetical protein